MESYNQELYHYGVKGQKWGVRRYRNEDGSLTPAGRRKQQRAEIDAKRISNRVAKARKNNKHNDKAEKFIEKIKKKYANTPFSDVTVYEHHIENGKIYVGTLMGFVGYSPYDGSPRYEVTAGTWVR